MSSGQHKSAAYIVPEAPISGGMELHNIWLYDNFSMLQRANVGEVLFHDEMKVQNTTSEEILFTHTFAAGELTKGLHTKFEFFGQFSTASGSDDFEIALYYSTLKLLSLQTANGNVADMPWSGSYEIIVDSEGVNGKLFDHLQMTTVGEMLKAAMPNGLATDLTGEIPITATIKWANAKAGNIFKLHMGKVSHTHAFGGW